jgi:hypothetical protein
MSTLKIVYCKGPDYPGYDKYQSDDDELAMMEMESHMMDIYTR